MRRGRLLIAAASLFAAPPTLADEVCANDQACAPWQVCTTSVGECGDAFSPADVCTGTCQAGRRLRVVLRARAAVAPGFAPFAGAVGVEVVPPFGGGHVSVGGEAWTAGLFRLGPVISMPLAKGLVASARADVCRDATRWLACPAARLEYFPWWQLPWLTPAHYLSLSAEGGALIRDEAGRAGASPAFLLGIGIWL